MSWNWPQQNVIQVEDWRSIGILYEYVKRQATTSTLRELSFRASVPPQVLVMDPSPTTHDVSVSILIKSSLVTRR